MKSSHSFPNASTKHNLYGSVLPRNSTIKFPYMPSFASSPYESGLDSSAPAGYLSQSDTGLYSQSDIDGGSITSDQEYLTTDIDNREERAILQATVFVEDAIEHRSIHHKVDTDSLTKYRLYHSKFIRWVLRITITVLLALAFFEVPSSLTVSSDPRKREKRYQVPCGVSETVELACLLILSVDMFFKVLMVGVRQAKKTNWLIATFLVLAISYLDWFVSISYVCDERWRVRRLLRPFFLIQNSSLMKKTVQSIQRSVPQILSVLFLMALHVYFFTMLGMVLFTPENLIFNATDIHPDQGSKPYHRNSIDILNDQNEGKAYFADTGAAVISLLVLLTTANNPDVMMPAYSDNRFYALYFILFLAIGMYFFLNVLLAVMYNQFKGSFTKSMQSSFLRRRVGIRAAFEVLRATTFYSSPLESPRNSVDVSLLKQVIEKIHFSKKSRYLPFLEKAIDKLPTPSANAKQFQEIFDIVFHDSIKTRPKCRQFQRPILKKIQEILLHTYFQYFGDIMSLLNVLVVTVELANSVTHAFSGHSMLSIFNFCFIFYYAIEQTMMIYFIGPKRYFSHKNVWFESGITWLLVVVEILCIALYGGPFPYLTEQEIIRRSQKFQILSLYNLLRMTNMLIIIRLLRIIPSIKPLFMVASTLVDLIKNMRAFGGIVIMIYYVFAILGMMVFEGKSPPPPENSSLVAANITCGTYEQLEYYANNFDDFAASLVVLWDVMVVNNWFVFLRAYNKTTSSRFTQIYFIIWWLVAAVVSMNLFVALVIEAFITQWERSERTEKPVKKHKKRKFAHSEETSRHFRVHEMFRAEYREPTEDELLKEIFSHPYLRKYTLVQRNTLND